MKHLAEKPGTYSAKAETGFAISNTSKLLIESMFFAPAGVFPRGRLENMPYSTMPWPENAPVICNVIRL